MLGGLCKPIVSKPKEKQLSFLSSHKKQVDKRQQQDGEMRKRATFLQFDLSARIGGAQDRQRLVRGKIVCSKMTVHYLFLQ